MTTGRTLGTDILEFEILSGAEAQDSGDFDKVFRQFKVVATADRIGKTKRQDHVGIVQVPGQLDTGAAFLRSRQTPGGNVPEIRAVAFVHRRNLERCGLWDAERGKALIQTNDRFKRVLNRKGAPKFVPPDPPGLYVQRADAWASDDSVVEFELAEHPTG